MSAWGAPAGAWANAVEEEEQENGGIEVPVAKEEEFPSLGAAVAPAASKKGKKKKQTMSLGEFVSGGGPGPAARADLLMSLPTAPRARQQGDAEVEGGETLGGAFKSYGGGQQQRGRFDRDERPPRRGPREDDMPSRADATDDWGSERKFVPSGGAGGGGFDRERRGFGGGFREERPPRDEPSRADLANDWGANRPRFPSPRGHPRRDGSRERFSRADQEARWGHRSDAPPTAFDDRPRRGFNDDWRRADDQHNGSSEAPKERPKLKLKPRSKPIDQSTDAQPRASIFGGAKPREEILKERPSSVTTDDVEEKIENLNVNAD